MADSSNVDRPDPARAPTRYYPRRDMMLGLYGLAMVVVLAGVVVVLLVTVFASGSGRLLLIPAVLLLLVGMGLALLGQLMMTGRRLNVELSDTAWSVHPLWGRSRRGAWMDVESVTVPDDARTQLVLSLADGRTWALETRWLDAPAQEIAGDIRERLNDAHGYRPVG